MPKDTKEDARYKKVCDVAQFINRSVRRVQQLTQEGILPTIDTPSGRRYDFVITIKRYIKFLQDKLDAKGKTTEEQESEKLAAEIRYKNSKAEQEELKLNELKNSLHRSEDVKAAIENLALGIRNMLITLPSRLAIDLNGINDPNEIALIVQKEVRSILGELSEYQYDPDYFRKCVREREGWDKTENDEEEEE